MGYGLHIKPEAYTNHVITYIQRQLQGRYLQIYVSSRNNIRDSDF